MNESITVKVSRCMDLLDLNIYTINEMPKDLINYDELEGYEGVRIRFREYFPVIIAESVIAFVNLFDDKKYLITFPKFDESEYGTITKIKEYQLENSKLDSGETHLKYILFILCLLIPFLGLALYYLLSEKFRSYRTLAMFGFIGNCLLLGSFMLDMYNYVSTM